MISIFCLVIVTLVSLLTFRRLRKLENENHLYKLKIDLYNKITYRLYQLYQFYDKASHRHTELKDEDEKEKLAEHVDNKGYALEDFIDENTLLLPENIIESLEEFILKPIYHEDPGITTLEGGLKKIYLEINSIVNLFRKDLNIESVNRRLHIRTR